MVDGNALEDILGLVKVLGTIAGILTPPVLSLVAGAKGLITYFASYRPALKRYNAKILDKPRTLVRGESWTSKSPNKLRTLVRRNKQGLFDEDVNGRQRELFPETIEKPDFWKIYLNEIKIGGKSRKLEDI